MNKHCGESRSNFVTSSAVRIVAKTSRLIVRAALFVADRVAVVAMWAEAKSER